MATRQHTFYSSRFCEIRKPISRVTLDSRDLFSTICPGFVIQDSIPQYADVKIVGSSDHVNKFFLCAPSCSPGTFLLKLSKIISVGYHSLAELLRARELY